LDFFHSFSAFVSFHGKRVSVVLVGAWCPVTASSVGDSTVMGMPSMFSFVLVFDSFAFFLCVGNAHAFIDDDGLASHGMTAKVEEFWWMYLWRWGVVYQSFVPPRQF
jgi:hypothetical protein